MVPALVIANEGRSPWAVISKVASGNRPSTQTKHNKWETVAPLSSNSRIFLLFKTRDPSPWVYHYFGWLLEEKTQHLLLNRSSQWDGCCYHSRKQVATNEDQLIPDSPLPRQMRSQMISNGRGRSLAAPIGSVLIAAGRRSWLLQMHWEHNLFQICVLILACFWRWYGNLIAWLSVVSVVW